MMAPIPLFHSLVFVSLFVVVISGAIAYYRCWRRMVFSELVGVILSVIAAVYWIAASYQLSNIVTCRADTVLCVAGTVYQLIRNTAFVAFHCAVEKRAAIPISS